MLSKLTTENVLKGGLKTAVTLLRIVLPAFLGLFCFALAVERVMFLPGIRKPCQVLS